MIPGRTPGWDDPKLSGPTADVDGEATESVGSEDYQVEVSVLLTYAYLLLILALLFLLAMTALAVLG